MSPNRIRLLRIRDFCASIPDPERSDIEWLCDAVERNEAKACIASELRCAVYDMERSISKLERLPEEL